MKSIFLHVHPMVLLFLSILFSPTVAFTLRLLSLGLPFWYIIMTEKFQTIFYISISSLGNDWNRKKYLEVTFYDCSQIAWGQIFFFYCFSTFHKTWPKQKVPDPGSWNFQKLPNQSLLHRHYGDLSTSLNIIKWFE